MNVRTRTTHQSPVTALRERRAAHAARRAARRRRAALAHDLAAFHSAADLAELTALLGRYDDADSAPIRELVDWTRAA